SRSTSARARTAPNDLLSPRKLSSGWVDSLATGAAAWATGLLDSGGRAGALRLGDAYVGRLDGAVLDHRGRQVLGGDPGRRQVHGLSVGGGLRVPGGGGDRSRRMRP